MLKPGYMFSSDENSRRTTEAVMSEMISMVTHITCVTRTHTQHGGFWQSPEVSCLRGNPAPALQNENTAAVFPSLF